MDYSERKRFRARLYTKRCREKKLETNSNCCVDSSNESDGESAPKKIKIKSCDEVTDTPHNNSDDGVLSAIEQKNFNKNSGVFFCKESIKSDGCSTSPCKQEEADSSDNDFTLTDYETVTSSGEDSDSSYISSEGDSVFNDDDQDNEEILQEETLEDKIRDWATSTNTPHSHIDGLLSIIKPVIKELPNTAKTLFKSSYGHQYEIEQFPTLSKNPKVQSEFVYFGLTEHLQSTVDVKNHEKYKIVLLIFVDGLPLYNSSKVEFWPILGKIFSKPDHYDPFIIACYSGEGKPCNSFLYFDKFIKEVNHVQQNGIVIDGFKFTVQIKCFLSVIKDFMLVKDAQLKE